MCHPEMINERAIFNLHCIWFPVLNTFTLQFFSGISIGINLLRMYNKCWPFITNLHGSIHFTAVKHEEEVVQAATGCLPGHVFDFFIEELGSPQSQSCVHHLSPEKGTYNYPPLFLNIRQQCFEKKRKRSHLARLKASLIICTRLITGISWNVNKELTEEVKFGGSVIQKHCRNNIASFPARAVVPDVGSSAWRGDAPSFQSHSWLCRSPSYLCWPPTSH